MSGKGRGVVPEGIETEGSTIYTKLMADGI